MLAIIVLMVTVVLANTHDGSIEAKVKISQSLILDTAKETRSKSIAVKQFTSAVFPSYGLDFDTSLPQQVIVYADCVPNDHAAIDPSDTIVDADDTFDYAHNDCGPSGNLVNKITLDENTKISAIRATYPVNGVMQTFTETRADVLFLRPDPTLWITTSSGGLIPTGNIEIDVSDLGNKFIRTDIINSSGEISEK